MLILAFDTTNERGGAGLFRERECLGEETNQGGANYSVTLFEMVDRLLTANHTALRDVDVFAVASGPGSFTGIRVGVAAAQGWATAFSRPVRGVSVVEAMVEAAQPRTDRAAAFIDARRGEFFLGIFRKGKARGGKEFEPAGEGMMVKPENIQACLQAALGNSPGLTCIVREYDQAAATFKTSLPARVNWQVVQGTLVSAIARLALEAHHRGELQSPAELDAYYIRRSDAELHWRG